jgi:O-antigen ligase
MDRPRSVLSPQNPIPKDAPNRDGRVLALAMAASVGCLVQAGAFKATKLLAGFPIDLTLILIISTIVAQACLWITGQGLRPATLTGWYSLLVLVLIGVPFSGDTAYSVSKVTQLFTLVALISLISASASCKTYFICYLVAVQVALGVAMMVMLRVGGVADPYGARLVLDGSTTIGSARVVGGAAVALSVYAICGRKHVALSGAATFALAGTLIAVGSKGPLFFAAIAILIVCLFGRAKLEARIGRAFMAAILLLTVFGVLFEGSTSGLGVSRLLSPLTNHFLDNSTAQRMGLLRSAWGLAQDAPFGVGWGNFATAAQTHAVPRVGPYVYPHNLIAEVTVEAGWLGLALLLFILALSLRALWRRSNDRIGAAIFALAIYYVLNAMVSGDITSNRAMWLFVGVGIGHASSSKLLRARGERASEQQSDLVE